MWQDYFRPEEMTSRATAIKAKCWDCCNWCPRPADGDITPRDCNSPDCPLYGLRPLGKRPMTLEQREAASARCIENPTGFAK